LGSKTEEGLIMDKMGASLIEIQNNIKYKNVKKAIEKEEKS
jgi:hypothetical protein